VIKTLYDDAPALLTWFRQAPRSWVDYLTELRDDEVKQLKQTKDLIDLGRSQGKLELLDRLSGLKEELASRRS
jgi:hypothetical protein